MTRGHIPRFGPLFWSTFSIACVLIAAYGLWLAVPALYESWTTHRLVQQLRQGDIEEKEDALSQLQDRGVEPVGDLIAMLADPDVDVRVFASNALLKENDAELRSQVAEAIGSMGADAAPAVEALIRCVRNDPDYYVQCCAAEALGEIGPAAKSAVPTLQAVLRNGDSLGDIAAEALQKIAPK